MHEAHRVHMFRRVATRLLLLGGALLLLAGCGGSDGSSSSSSSKRSGGDDDSVLPIDRYADTELSELSIEQLQACETDTTFAHRVLYEGHEAEANCGTGTATVKAGTKSFDIEHGWCEVDDDYVQYHFGTTVLDMSDDADTDPTYGPASFGLTLGAQVEGAKPVDKDGTYVDGPSTRPAYRSNLVIQHDPDNWTGDTLDHVTTVTLADDRTSGTVTATNFDGTALAVTFSCGDRITGTAAPEA